MSTTGFDKWKTSSDLYWWSSHNQFSLFFYTKACKSNWRVECSLMERRKNVQFRNSPIRPLHLLIKKSKLANFSAALKAEFIIRSQSILRVGVFFLHGRKKIKNMANKMLPFPHSNRKRSSSWMETAFHSYVLWYLSNLRSHLRLHQKGRSLVSQQGYEASHLSLLIHPLHLQEENLGLW